MEIKEVISQLESIKSNSEDFARSELSDPIWQADIEALDVAIEALKEKEFSGSAKPKELKLINISREV